MKFITNDNKKWWIFSVIALTQVVLNADFTAVNLALAPIAREFYVSMMSVQWATSAYIIISGAFMILSGRLSDILGRKFIFVSGIVIFTVASIMAGLSANLSFLIVSRIIQGIGFAALFPVSIAMVFDAFPTKQQGFAIGSTIAVGGLSQSLGPGIGGIIIHTLGWRWIFFLNAPIGLLCTGVALFVCQREKPLETKKSIDYLGSFLLASAFIFIMLFFNQQLHTSICVISFLLGLVFLMILIFVEKNIKYPIIDIILFKNHNFIIYNITRSLFGFGFFSVLFILGIYMQNILGYSAVHSGLLILFMSLIYGVFASVMGKWIDFTSAKLNLKIGLIISAIAFVLLTFISAPKTWSTFIFPLIVTGIGFTFTIPSNATAAFKSVKPEKTATASGIYYTNAIIGGAIGIAVTALLISKISLHFLKASLISNGLKVSAKQFEFLTHVASGTNSINNMHQYFSHQLISKLIPITQTSFLEGFKVSMWCCTFLCLVALGLLRLIRQEKQ